MALHIYDGYGNETGVVKTDEEVAEDRRASIRAWIFIIVCFIAYCIWENREYTETTYYPNGNIEMEQTFRSQKLNGISKTYYENGNLKTSQFFKDGKLDGVSVEYNENGTIEK